MTVRFRQNSRIYIYIYISVFESWTKTTFILLRSGETFFGSETTSQTPAEYRESAASRLTNNPTAIFTGTKRDSRGVIKRSLSDDKRVRVSFTKPNRPCVVHASPAVSNDAGSSRAKCFVYISRHREVYPSRNMRPRVRLQAPRGVPALHSDIINNNNRTFTEFRR